MHAHGRQAVFLYLLIASVALQLTFFVEALGFPLDPGPMRWAIAVVLPFVGIAWRLRFHPAPPPPPTLDWPSWILLGLAIFGLWAGSYFAIGALDPTRWRVLPLTWADQLFPFLPVFSLVYLCVHPLYLLPFACLETTPALRRLALGDVAIIVVSVIVWAVVPVHLPRIALHDGGGTGVWLLRTIWARDPPTNCLPSTHCSMALHAALHLRERGGNLGRWAMATAIAIGFATLCTRQHYVADVVSGFALGGAVYLIGRHLVPTRGAV